ncbi:oxidoreductase [Planobispora rosea]|uniref:Oxidoreductase n=1 Tax=Planobispora rosea TaxID=35762 RepID=A0A8J3RXY6_PLARO|nr:FAD-binding oxidoreductase [Planobispora rosea]GGS85723.1 oxidoreductase [Planobispora rosea]GIH83355.1 oxidoreductase [Planobispora rosea]
MTTSVTATPAATSAATPAVTRAARRLGGRFAGTVHLPGEPGYEVARRPLFPVTDPWPALVAEAAGPQDVRAAVLTAREQGLPLAVQATGHGTHVPCDGGLLLKTTGMAGVLIDPERRIARVGPGAQWGRVLAAAAPFGLAPLSGSSPDVGVTGYTLGGGLGWLARRYGFAADSVLRAEVVTADGRLVTAGPDSHPDLFWALRGGGGNFGVVTSLEFRLHPVARVHAGTACFPVERAAETLAFYREWIAGAPGELSTAVLLTRMPDSPQTPEPVRGRRVLAIKAMYAGGAEQARRALAPLWQAAGPVLLDDFRTVPYAEASMGGTAPRQVNLFGELPDPVIDALVRAADPESSPERVTTVEVRHWGGAMAHPGPGAGPVGHRDTSLSVIVDAEAPGLAAELRPYATGGAFLNFLHDTARTATAYTAADHRRLTEVKGVYDADNTFNLGHVIPPAPPAAGVHAAG